jgi:hypothetical protein
MVSAQPSHLVTSLPPSFSHRLNVAFYQRSHDCLMPDTDCCADARTTRQQGCKEHELRVTCLLRRLPDGCRVVYESKVLAFMIVADYRVLSKENIGLRVRLRKHNRLIHSQTPWFSRPISIWSDCASYHETMSIRDTPGYDATVTSGQWYHSPRSQSEPLHIHRENKLLLELA